MILNIVIFTVALYLVIKGAVMATKYAARVAESFHLSKYTVGFIVVAVISILPETFIAISSAVSGVPSFGFGMLLGSNVADLTLIFAIIVLYAGRGLKIESKILKNHSVYPFMLLLPLVLGFDGYFSRMEGVALIIVGAVFYYLALKNGVDGAAVFIDGGGKYKSFLMLIGSMVILLTGSHFIVISATALAKSLGVNSILIGMLIVGLGTTLPELFFSLGAVKKRDDSLAVGDILGTVLADATIVVGILALINPFAFPPQIIYITGVFMVAASFVLFDFMRSGRVLSRREAYMLFVLWLVFVFVEFFTTR
ncbi:MAG: sodium:calcium antiporter [Parcubacteria group bacterium]|nr:sodium:calcium antiporter [Parcubacteria group bacterium]